MSENRPNVTTEPHPSKGIDPFAVLDPDHLDPEAVVHATDPDVETPTHLADIDPEAPAHDYEVLEGEPNEVEDESAPPA